jgi:hypothetical protein
MRREIIARHVCRVTCGEFSEDSLSRRPIKRSGMVKVNPGAASTRKVRTIAIEIIQGYAQGTRCERCFEFLSQTGFAGAAPAHYSDQQRLILA